MDQQWYSRQEKEQISNAANGQLLKADYMFSVGSWLYLLDALGKWMVIGINAGRPSQ